jgi:phytanoyl-CoA hydroxylase
MRLSEADVERFNSEGYLLVRGALEESDLDPVIAEYASYIDRRAGELLAAGKISQLYANEPFDRRLACICSENNEIYGELDIMHLRGRASFEFLGNDNLLDLIEGLVGPEITCSPIQHVRPKLPSGLTPSGSDAHVVPWHQDAGVTWEEADPYFILTVWLPLVPSTQENGCLEIIPRTHGRGLWQHHSKPGVGTTIVDEAMPEETVEVLPMERGDVLLMHKEIPHRSKGNFSQGIRWSMDLRYQQTGTPTGRPFQPDFPVRSAANPDSVLRDYDEWCRRWEDALAAPPTRSAHRWAAATP